MEIIKVNNALLIQWLQLRKQLWPAEDDEHLAEMAAWLESEAKEAFLYLNDTGKVIGFAECALREYAEGCSTSPVSFLEGIYVDPAYRRQGIAKALVHRVKRWALAKGCTEMASDTLIENEESITFHKKLGFLEIERIVCFAKKIDET